ncbi:MAG: hypothetical protein LBR24_00795 [Methanobrevibacter sp.]|jgi:hypothetical protein|nr:hypothetical protein [Methanobrevibacter sp.]
MRKRNIAIIGAIIIVVVAVVYAASFFVFQGDEEGVCPQCKMLDCHGHATGDNYCCDMCEMGEDSKCDCPMPNEKDVSSSGNNSSDESNSSDMNMSNN